MVTVLIPIVYTRQSCYIDLQNEKMLANYSKLPVKSIKLLVCAE